MSMQGMPQGQMQMNGNANMNNMYNYGMQQRHYWMNQMNNMPMLGMQQGQNWMNYGMSMMPMGGENEHDGNAYEWHGRNVSMTQP